MLDKPDDDEISHIHDIMMDFYLKLFEKMKEEHPDVAEAHEKEFDEFIETWKRICEEYGGKSSLSLVEELIPENFWIQMLKLFSKSNLH